MRVGIVLVEPYVKPVATQPDRCPKQNLVINVVTSSQGGKARHSIYRQGASQSSSQFINEASVFTVHFAKESRLIGVKERIRAHMETVYAIQVFPVLILGAEASHRSGIFPTPVLYWGCWLSPALMLL
jgi:hypothetical protein